MKQLAALVFGLSLIFTPAGAAAQSDPYVPDQLKAWVPWVLQRDPERACAMVGAGRVCDWPGRIKLDVDRGGARFEFDLSLDQKGQVLLPGGKNVYPFNVALKGAPGAVPLAVTFQNGAALVHLPAGQAVITGEFENKGLAGLKEMFPGLDSPADEE